MNKPLEQDIRYRLFKILSDDADLNQREIARKMGISLGKTNYCLSEFTRKGFIKIQHFSESKTKFRYLYILTPKGIEEKSRLTVRFFKRKLVEYEQIKQQIEELGREISGDKIAFPEGKNLSDLIGKPTISSGLFK